MASAPTTRSSGIGKVRREHDRGPVLPAAEAAVAADEALERRDLLGSGVDQAVDVDVRAFGTVRDALDEFRGIRTEREERVLALDVPVVEPVPAVVAQRDRAVVVEHDHEADARMPGQPVDESGEAFVQRRRVSCCFSPRT